MEIPPEDPSEEARARSYREEGLAIWRAIEASGTLRRMATSLRQIPEGTPREKSKSAERALTSSLPETITNSRGRPARIYAGHSEDGPAIDDCFWVDFIVEQSGRRFFFEFKAVSDNYNASNLGAQGTLGYMLGGPMASPYEPVSPEPARMGELLARAMRGVDSLAEPRDIFIVTLDKRCLSGRLGPVSLARSISVVPLSQISADCLRANRYNGLQVRFGRLRSAGRPRGPREARKLLAWLAFEVEEKRALPYELALREIGSIDVGKRAKGRPAKSGP